MKILKVFYYAFQPIALLLIISVIRYLMGDESMMNMERIIICVAGGFFLGCVWLLIDTFKKRFIKSKV